MALSHQETSSGDATDLQTVLVEKGLSSTTIKLIVGDPIVAAEAVRRLAELKPAKELPAGSAPSAGPTAGLPTFF